MKKLLLAAAIFLSTATTIRADEGMWMLPDLKTQNEAAMMALGLQIPVETIYNTDSLCLKDAVVQFGKGCTGEVISSQGLVLTNHHCGYAYIQQHSNVNNDYLTKGFVARTQREELPCPGLSVTFIDRILDITSYVREQLQKESDPQGVKSLSPKYLQKLAEQFALQEGIALGRGGDLELKAFYGGNRYHLFVKKIYRDIRMVLAPPSSIGKFGADTDNWMWPRHTGDFCLFRIYATPTGEPADYSTVNMPLRPKKHLRISLEGYSEGDFAFVMGFPGTTYRYMISDEVRERMETTNFMRIHIRDARQKLLMKEMQSNDAIRIHYASIYARSANAWKNALGMNEGLISLHVFDTKHAQEQELLQWEAAKGDTTCAAAYRAIENIVAQRHDARYHQQCLQEAFVTGMEFMRIPSTTALVTALKDKNKRHIQRATDSLRIAAERYFSSIPFADVERKVAKEMMRQYCKYIPVEQRIVVVCNLNDRGVDVKWQRVFDIVKLRGAVGVVVDNVHPAVNGTGQLVQRHDVHFRIHAVKHHHLTAGELVHHFFAAAQLGFIIEMGIVDHTAEIVLPGFCQLGNDFVHFLADVFIAFQGNQIVETAAFRNSDIGIFYTLELVRDILHEQQGQDIVLILRGVHAASQFITARPKGTIQLIFLYRHVCLPHFS